MFNFFNELISYICLMVYIYVLRDLMRVEKVFSNLLFFLVLGSFFNGFIV